MHVISPRKCKKFGEIPEMIEGICFAVFMIGLNRLTLERMMIKPRKQDHYSSRNMTCPIVSTVACVFLAAAMLFTELCLWTKSHRICFFFVLFLLPSNSKEYTDWWKEFMQYAIDL